jgi:hypothetical protein
MIAYSYEQPRLIDVPIFLGQIMNFIGEKQIEGEIKTREEVLRVLKKDS